MYSTRAINEQLFQASVTAAHLLPLLIPHAVVNRDVTRHISAQCWVAIVSAEALTPGDEEDETGSDMSLLARRAISLKGWDPCDALDRARIVTLTRAAATDAAKAALRPLADLVMLREYFTGRSFAPALSELEEAIRCSGDPIEQPGDAPLFPSDAAGNDETSNGCLGRLSNSPAVQRAAAWLRRCPSRRPIDLPCITASTLRVPGQGRGTDEIPLRDMARLLSHAVVTNLELYRWATKRALRLEDVKLFPHITTLTVDEYSAHGGGVVSMIRDGDPALTYLAAQVRTASGAVAAVCPNVP